MFIGYMDPTVATYSPQEYPPAPPEAPREDQQVRPEAGGTTAADSPPPPADEYRGNHVDETA
ncbi:MAG: hypothetical protein EA428_08595 [Spirochaetaceae bacterium]|nr:MAG: hypothetical protein EA428_08595 [Spirochaetaceae bacterium]